MAKRYDRFIFQTGRSLWRNGTYPAAFSLCLQRSLGRCKPQSNAPAELIRLAVATIELSVTPRFGRRTYFTSVGKALKSMRSEFVPKLLLLSSTLFSPSIYGGFALSFNNHVFLVPSVRHPNCGAAAATTTRHHRIGCFASRRARVSIVLPPIVMEHSVIPSKVAEHRYRYSKKRQTCGGALRMSSGGVMQNRAGGQPVSARSKIQKLEASLERWCDLGTSAFPLWVLGAAVLGLTRPETLAWFGSDLITAALTATMVCMGMTLRVEDFAAIARRPKPVIAGVAAQYTVMPFLGFFAGRLWKLPPALAAGVALVGCCPGGTASNLVTLIAKGDVALSVSMTTVSTLLAAAVTGPLTKFLVGSLVSISAMTLMVTTAQVIFLPVALGLLLSTFAEGLTRRLSPYTPLLCVALVALICGSVVAQNASILLGSGAGLVGAVLTLHAGGFAIGYGLMRCCGFSERQARTASIEVGMQNSALAVVLAQRGLADPLSAIPGAVSATCHSLVGSALAAYWRATDRRTAGNSDSKTDNSSSSSEGGAPSTFAYEI